MSEPSALPSAARATEPPVDFVLELTVAWRFAKDLSAEVDVYSEWVDAAGTILSGPSQGLSTDEVHGGFDG